MHVLGNGPVIRLPALPVLNTALFLFTGFRVRTRPGTCMPPHHSSSETVTTLSISGLWLHVGPTGNNPPISTRLLRPHLPLLPESDLYSPRSYAPYQLSNSLTLSLLPASSANHLPPSRALKPHPVHAFPIDPLSRLIPPATAAQICVVMFDSAQGPRICYC
jgi:hypothetical protein